MKYNKTNTLSTKLIDAQVYHTCRILYIVTSHNFSMDILRELYVLNHRFQPTFDGVTTPLLEFYTKNRDECNKRRGNKCILRYVHDGYPRGVLSSRSAKRVSIWPARMYSSGFQKLPLNLGTTSVRSGDGITPQSVQLLSISGIRTIVHKNEARVTQNDKWTRYVTWTKTLNNT